MIWVYDLEIFKYNRLLVGETVDFSQKVVIWDDNFKIKEFMKQNPLLGGFNNKWYDNYILKVMLNGGNNVEVKKANDWIIGGNLPWKMPYLEGCRTYFDSFDLRDDLPRDLSLKQIMGNMGYSIVESSVPFDIDRPLTEEEKRETEEYCTSDVEKAIHLYHARKESYFDAKVEAGRMFGIKKETALSYTNAKLSAIALDAKHVERDDEREYYPPSFLPLEDVPKIVLDFYAQLHDKSISDVELFGDGKNKKGKHLDFWWVSGGGKCPVTVSWGGIHGAPLCETYENDDEYVLINQDVGSLYPSSMLNFGFCSRNMSDPENYRKVVETRLAYKKQQKQIGKLMKESLGDNWYKECVKSDGTFTDKAKGHEADIRAYINAGVSQASLKLIINTVYGAMLCEGNALQDRLMGRSVCITNQICMCILLTRLTRYCPSIHFVNINTDGVMYRIRRDEVEFAENVVREWCDLTGFTMERDDFCKVIQKDVNNYIGIYEDGHFKTKGGFVSLYKGGSFKSNSLSIIDKAVVDYLVDGVAPEQTIRSCDEMIRFQNIVKAGGEYKEMWTEVDGELVPVNKCNRIYAVKDSKYGSTYKVKYKDGAMKKSIVPDCPPHVAVDNDNHVTRAELDEEYYIKLAKAHIDAYLIISDTNKKKLEKIVDMVQPEVYNTDIPEKEVKHMSNVFTKLLDAREQFAQANVKKKGVNAYAEFDYFRLEEIIPVKQRIFKSLGLCDVISFTDDLATLTIIDASEPDSAIQFTSQLDVDESMIKNPIQKVGAIQTYVRRYLYMLALDIIESDGIEATTGKTDSPTPFTPQPSKEVEKKREDAAQQMTRGAADKMQIEAIKKALVAIRENDGDASYIAQCIQKIKKGLTRTEAAELLKEIQNKS